MNPIFSEDHTPPDGKGPNYSILDTSSSCSSHTMDASHPSTSTSSARRAASQHATAAGASDNGSDASNQEPSASPSCDSGAHGSSVSLSTSTTDSTANLVRPQPTSATPSKILAGGLFRQAASPSGQEKRVQMLVPDPDDASKAMYVTVFTIKDGEIVFNEDTVNSIRNPETGSGVDRDAVRTIVTYSENGKEREANESDNDVDHDAIIDRLFQDALSFTPVMDEGFQPKKSAMKKSEAETVQVEVHSAQSGGKRHSPHKKTAKHGKKSTQPTLRDSVSTTTSTSTKVSTLSTSTKASSASTDSKSSKSRNVKFSPETRDNESNRKKYAEKDLSAHRRSVIRDTAVKDANIDMNKNDVKIEMTRNGVPVDPDKVDVKTDDKGVKIDMKKQIEVSQQIFEDVIEVKHFDKIDPILGTGMGLGSGSSSAESSGGSTGNQSYDALISKSAKKSQKQKCVLLGVFLGVLLLIMVAATIVGVLVPKMMGEAHSTPPTTAAPSAVKAS